MSEAQAETLCEVRGVAQDFKLPDGRPHRTLENINLAIKSNEVVALLGPSGCGKSTLLRILAGLITPTLGEVIYRGKKLEGLNPAVGIVFQSFALYPWMTLRQNVEAVLQAAGLETAVVHSRAADVLGKVGLATFVDAYPRELSGGMKQRVGIARALSIDPELLFMDEPFSQVDALTAESLRAEVIDIWSDKERNPSSILMVSHDIKEVVYMADRVVVLGANPGRILTIMENRLPRPRDYRSAPFLRLVDQLHEIITGHELPDVPEAPSASFEPLPPVASSEIIGLLEYLDARNGQDDLFHIASDTNREFGQMIAVTKAAEMLDLVETPKRMVALSQDGKRFVSANLVDRKQIWREKLLTLRLFREVNATLQRQPKRALDAEVVQEIIVLNLPQENYEQALETLVRWARYGELFSYDDERKVLSLPASSAPQAAANA